jgi:hypothetical protein
MYLPFWGSHSEGARVNGRAKPAVRPAEEVRFQLWLDTEQSPGNYKKCREYGDWNHRYAQNDSEK